MEQTSDDQVPELESEVIFRVPTEAAAVLRELINKDAKKQIYIKLENDIRRGEVIIGNHHLFAKVVNLPTIIEAQKTIDNKTIYKTADICQMVLCKEEKEFLMSDDEDKTKVLEKKEPYKVDSKYLWPHGITPPLKNVKKKRFRKISEKDVDDPQQIEQEVKYLLKSDSEALSVKWEVIPETELQNKTKIKDNVFMHGEIHNDVNDIERDIFGETVSDSDEETDSANIIDVDDYTSDLTAYDNHLSDTYSFTEETPSVSGSQSLVTELKKEMFVFDDYSHHHTNVKNIIDLTDGKILPYKEETTEDFKPELKFMDDNKLGDLPVVSTFVGLGDGNLCSDNIKQQIDELQHECKKLREQKIQQDIDIENIENIKLKERFINISNNLLTDLLKKKNQIEDLEKYL